MNALLAAHHGVPVALATGDEALVRELGDRLGGAEFVAVKRAIRRTTAELLHPEVTASRIREAAARALRNLPDAPPPPEAPVEVEIRYTRPDLAEIASLLPEIERSAPDTVRFRTGDMAEAYAIIPRPLPQSFRVRSLTEMPGPRRSALFSWTCALVGFAFFAAGGFAREGEEETAPELGVPLHGSWARSEWRSAGRRNSDSSTSIRGCG